MGLTHTIHTRITHTMTITIRRTHTHTIHTSFTHILHIAIIPIPAAILIITKTHMKTAARYVPIPMILLKAIIVMVTTTTTLTQMVTITVTTLIILTIQVATGAMHIIMTILITHSKIMNISADSQPPSLLIQMQQILQRALS